MRRTGAYAGLGVCMLVWLACGTSGEDTSSSSPTTITVVSARYGTALDAQYRITAPAETFAPMDPVSISLEIEGRPEAGTVMLRWPLGGSNVEASVDLATVNSGVLVSVGQNTFVGGTLTHTGPLPPGDYETIVLFNGTEVGRYPFVVAGALPPGTVTAAISGPFTTEPGTPRPAPTNPFPSATTTIHAAWDHMNVPANEQLTFALVAVDVGTAAAPGSQVSSAQTTVPEAGPHNGPLQFSLPRPWPPGSYRITGTGNTLGEFATLEFTVQ